MERPVKFAQSFLVARFLHRSFWSRLDSGRAGSVDDWSRWYPRIERGSPSCSWFVGSCLWLGSRVEPHNGLRGFSVSLPFDHW